MTNYLQGTIPPVRILHDFHHFAPTRFHLFVQGIKKGLIGNPKIPESVWAAHPDLIPSFLSTLDRHEAVYPDANFGHKVAIAERDVLQAQLVIYLDQIASILEAAAIGNPDMLVSSGFNLAKERRARSRAKGTTTVKEDATTTNA